MSQTLIALSAGQVAYGGYTFNRSFILTDVSYQLLTDPVDLPFAPGSFSPTGKAGVKTFTVVGVIGGGGAILSQGGVNMQTADQVQAEVDLLMGLYTQGDQPFQWRPDRYVLAQMGRPKITYGSGEGYRFAVVTIDFVANDPRSYGYSLKTASATSGVNVGNGAGNSLAVAQVGSAKAYPTITVTFSVAATNLTLYGYSAYSSSYVALVMVGSFAVTDTIAVTCDPRSRSVTKNGVKTWSLVALPFTTFGPQDAAEFMPYITPGASFAVGISAATGTATAAASFRDTWA